MRITIIASVFMLASCVFAAMTEEVISLVAGQSVDIYDRVQWPAAQAVAIFDPAAKITRASGEIESKYLAFSERSGSIVVHGPTTVTLRYGTPDPVSTPDAIQ